MAYAKIEPFGGLVEDYRAGLGPAMYRNVKRAEGSDITRPLDFYPWRNEVVEADPQETREELERRIKRDLIGDG